MARRREAVGPSRLDTLDPGNNTGWATFEASKLVQARLLRGEDIRPFPWEGLVISEIPYIYPGGRGKGDGNDLIQVARIAGRLTASVPEDRLKFVYPKTWKGTSPDSVIFARIASRLTPEEKALLPGLDKFLASKFTGLLGNVLDAVGIGLKELGRL